MFGLFSRSSTKNPPQPQAAQATEKLQPRPKLPVPNGEFKVLVLGGARVGKKSIVNYFSRALPIRERQYRPGISIVSVLYPDHEVSLNLSVLRPQLPQWAQSDLTRVPCETRKLMLHFWVVSCEADPRDVLSENEIDELYQGADAIVYVCAHGHTVQSVRPGLAAFDVWFARSRTLRPLTGFLPSILLANKFDLVPKSGGAPSSSSTKGTNSFGSITMGPGENFLPASLLNSFCVPNGIAFWKNTFVPQPGASAADAQTAQSSFKQIFEDLIRIIIQHKVALQYPYPLPDPVAADLGLSLLPSQQPTTTQLPDQSSQVGAPTLQPTVSQSTLQTPESVMRVHSFSQSPTPSAISSQATSTATSTPTTKAFVGGGVIHASSELSRGTSAALGLAAAWVTKFPNRQPEASVPKDEDDASYHFGSLKDLDYDDQQVLEESSRIEAELEAGLRAPTNVPQPFPLGATLPPLIVGSVLKAPYYISPQTDEENNRDEKNTESEAGSTGNENTRDAALRREEAQGTR